MNIWQAMMKGVRRGEMDDGELTQCCTNKVSLRPSSWSDDKRDGELKMSYLIMLSSVAVVKHRGQPACRRFVSLQSEQVTNGTETVQLRSNKEKKQDFFTVVTATFKLIGLFLIVK